MMFDDDINDQQWSIMIDVDWQWSMIINIDWWQSIKVDDNQ